jgi:hypothetical protein
VVQRVAINPSKAFSGAVPAAEIDAVGLQLAAP